MAEKTSSKVPKKRKMSAAARKRIADAQRKRARSKPAPLAHCMCCPPLIAMFAPVTNAASSLAR